MGDRALETYESFFSRDAFAARALDHIAAIYRNRTHDERDFISQWDEMIEVARRRGDYSAPSTPMIGQPSPPYLD
jgi:hypothetical protein